MEQTKQNIPIFKTQCQEERDARDLALFNEYNELTSVEGQSKTIVVEHLMKKYNIHSQGTIYVIRKRVERMLSENKVREGQV